MAEIIKAGIVGYGNLGKGVKAAIKQNSDIELEAVFTRRPVDSLDIGDGIKVENVDAAKKYIDIIDVMLLCGGSATDLPVQGPQFAEMFNTVDSFDTHAKIPEYYQEMNKIAGENNNVCAISIGWDPGLFSLNRMIEEAVLPEGKDYTFWGPGVSQGHSDAVRRIYGVKDAVQYTIPQEDAIEKVRNRENPDLSTDEKHVRDCYVVAEEGADKARIEKEIKNMPNYFADYDTEVNFISQKELEENHSEMPHGGFVIRSGKTGEKGENTQIMEFSLDLTSNPEFTASVLVAYARAVYRLNKEGQSGARTILDIPPAYISSKDPAELRKDLL
ncbi:MAG: diaminopimelate dehydrogenase [Halanaerobiales bacterium]